MKSGRELDAMVTEKVMGWKRVILECDGVKVGDWIDGEKKPRCAGVPHYSTDISAAWEVVEKLVSNGDFSFFMGLHNTISDLKRCSFTNTEVEATVECCIHTVPVSICLAALKAVEHNERSEYGEQSET